MSRITAPPEGVALEQARRRAGLSQNEAGRKAGISGTRWRQIVSGVQPSGGGQIPVTGNARTVARMAWAVGLAPEELDEAGRDDAASELRDLLAEHPELRELRAEISALMAELPPKRRARLERLIAEEEAELERLRVERLRRLKELMESD